MQGVVRVVVVVMVVAAAQGWARPRTGMPGAQRVSRRDAMGQIIISHSYFQSNADTRKMLTRLTRAQNRQHKIIN